MKKILSILLIVFSTALLSNCSTTDSSTADVAWIDVRTVEEFSTDHIDGDQNIPLATIDVVNLATMYDKGDEINLYCRSGNRAGQAKLLLEAAGFTNVNNVGSIDDVRVLRNIAAQNSSQ